MSYPGDRRKRTERRIVDLGPPPGMRERRASEQRRATHVAEIELSPEEWEAHFSRPAAGSGEDHVGIENAAEILGRLGK